MRPVVHRTGLHRFPEDRMHMAPGLQACAAEMLLHLLVQMLFQLLVEVLLQQLREEAPLHGIKTMDVPFRGIRTIDMPLPARPVR